MYPYSFPFFRRSLMFINLREIKEVFLPQRKRPVFMFRFLLSSPAYSSSNKPWDQQRTIFFFLNCLFLLLSSVMIFQSLPFDKAVSGPLSSGENLERNITRHVFTQITSPFRWKYSSSLRASTACLRLCVLSEHPVKIALEAQRSSCFG